MTFAKKIHNPGIPPLALILYVGMVVISVLCLVLKRDAIQFHTRDYSYFIEQAARLADPNLANKFAMNIDGFNFLGLQGTEGVKSIYHAIHNEYFRYAYVLLYLFFQNTIPIYIFFCLVFFSPILYFAILARSTKGHSWQPAAGYAALFVLFPALLNSITFDMRPRILFIAGWSLMAIAIYFERPFLEKILLFGFLLAIREEGILLGAALIGLNFMRLQAKAGRWKQTLVLIGMDLLALGLFLAFMAWGGYNRVDVVADPLNGLRGLLNNNPVLLGTALMVFLLLTVWIGLKKRSALNLYAQLLCYSLGLAMTGFQFVREMNVWAADQAAQGLQVTLSQAYFKAATSPQSALFFYMLILLLVLFWDFSQKKMPVAFRFALGVLCLVFAITNLVSIPAQITSWVRATVPAELVWNFKGGIDRYKTNILVDYATYQVFYDCENILVYNRLPLWLVEPENRFYPDDQAALVKVIQQRMEYAVIALESVADIRALAQTAGVAVTQIAVNDRYAILKLR